MKRSAIFEPAIKVLFISGYAADVLHKKGLLEKGLNFHSEAGPDERSLAKGAGDPGR